MPPQRVVLFYGQTFFSCTGLWSLHRRNTLGEARRLKALKNLTAKLWPLVVCTPPESFNLHAHRQVCESSFCQSVKPPWAWCDVIRLTAFHVRFQTYVFDCTRGPYFTFRSTPTVSRTLCQHAIQTSCYQSEWNNSLILKPHSAAHTMELLGDQTERLKSNASAEMPDRYVNRLIITHEI